MKLKPLREKLRQSLKSIFMTKKLMYAKVKPSIPWPPPPELKEVSNFDKLKKPPGFRFKF